MPFICTICRQLRTVTTNQIQLLAATADDKDEPEQATVLRSQQGHQDANAAYRHYNRVSSGKQQQAEMLQRQARSLQQQFGSMAEDQQHQHRHIGQSYSRAKRSLLQDTEQSSLQALQGAISAAEQQIAVQAELISKLRLEAIMADRQLEKVTNLLQSQESHAQRLEEQLNSKADGAKTRFAKLSQHLEAERRTVKALRMELQSLTASSESQVGRLATELEAKQGLLRGLQSTVQSAKADAESLRIQAEAATSALARLKEAGADLERLSAQLNKERQVAVFCVT